MTADIEKEMFTIAEYVRPLFKWVRSPTLPDKYEPDGCVVRYQDTDQASETFVQDRFDRQFQIIVMADNELACLRYINDVQKHFTGVHSLLIKDSAHYLRVGSLLFSQPFLTEDKVVYAAIGVLHTQARAMREQPKYPPIGGVIITPGTTWPDDKPPVVGEVIETEIVIGKDCRVDGGNADG